MSFEEWHADIDITPEIVRGIVQEQFPSLLPIKAIHYIGEGWDNKLYLVNDKIIFRFPQRQAAIELMQRESILLNNLPDFKQIRIPRLTYQGHPTASHPYPCQGYDLIQGCSGYRAHLSDQDRCDNIAILAKFLKQLHSINVDDAFAMGAVSQGHGSRANIEETIKVLKERIDKLRLYNRIKINMSCLQDEIATIRHITLPDECCLVHGDLDSRHLIFDEKKLTGIIDWGDVDITNRAVDLDIVWTFFPSDCHAQFFEIYGTVDADTWSYARFLGLYCAFSLMLYSTDLQDEFLFTESVQAIHRINSHLIEKYSQ